MEMILMLRYVTFAIIISILLALFIPGCRKNNGSGLTPAETPLTGTPLTENVTPGAEPSPDKNKTPDKSPASTQTPVVLVVTATPEAGEKPTQTPVVIVATATPGAAVEPTPVVLVVTVIPDEGKEDVPHDYVESATEALDALEALNSVLEVSSSPVDFKEHLIAAKIAVDRFLTDQTEDHIPGLRREMEGAMDGYEGAADKVKELWKLKAKGDFSRDGPGLKKDAVTDLIKGREHTVNARNLLDKFR